jgi:FkbM family methyltransferase
VESAYAVTEQGRRIYVDPEDPRGSRLIAAAGDLNPHSLLLWQRALSVHLWDLVIDVGVNYGEMLVGATLPSTATVIGFEPNLALHPHLRRTLDENDITLDLRSEAVADRPGVARFAVDHTWSGTSSLDAGDHDEPDRWEFTEVQVTTLERVIGSPQQSFCVKVDVEGFEHDVIAGATRVLDEAERWVVMLEVHHMSRPYLASLAERYPVFLMDVRTRDLHRVPGGNADIMGRALSSGWLHFQDCLVASPETARDLGRPQIERIAHA